MNKSKETEPEEVIEANMGRLRVVKVRISGDQLEKYKESPPKKESFPWIVKVHGTNPGPCQLVGLAWKDQENKLTMAQARIS